MKQNLRSAKVSAEDAARVKEQVSNILLTYTVLNLAVSDIKFEFDDVGRYKQRTKVLVNRIEKAVVQLFNSVRYRLLKGSSENIVYDKWNSRVCEAVGEAVLLEAPERIEASERSVNIALACCRLILEEDKKMGNIYIEEVPPLVGVLRNLQQLGIKDYGLDFLIQKTIENI